MTGAYGILFQDEMVRAILDGRKTVTRRTSDVWGKRKPGDLLWVRECHCSADMGPLREGGVVAYRSDYSAERIQRDRLGPWKSSIHMPRWASRITLRVVSVQHEWGNNWPDAPGARPGPLPCVDDDEARREGVADRAAYLRLWESINGPDYPAFVWRIEFERVAS